MKCTRPQTMDYHKWNSYQVPCGYCPACRYNNRVGWTFRISEHAKHSKEAWFITLTYNEQNLPILSEGELIRGSENNNYDAMETLDVQDVVTFINSVKKRQSRAYNEYAKTALSPIEAMEKPKIAYYLVGEYGGKTGRPHYHLIVFNLWESIAKELELEKIWQKGRIETESANPKLIHYITGYLYDKSKYVKGKQVKPFMRCSKGLGEQYVSRAKKYHKETLNPFVWFNGTKIAMPKYLRDKIFNAEEEELIKQKIQDWHTKEESAPLMNETKEARQQVEHSIISRQTKRRL